MSRFKFRAWDEYSKRMVYNDFNIWCNGEVSDTEGNYLDNLMQCTGKKDTAGVDVYEGDIIKYTDCMGEDEETCFAPIVWKEKQAQLFPDVIDMFWPLDMVVVGNVYENSDIIES